MMIVDSKEVERNFDDYINIVEQGEIVQISENGKIVAELQPIEQTK